MKPKNIPFFVVLSTFSLPIAALAQGGGHVGGGDSCRDELQKHRETLYQWVQSGYGADLNFGRAQGSAHDFATYQRHMLEVLQPGKVVVTCYLDPARIQDPEAQRIAREEGVSYKSITIGNPPTPTACINYEDAAGVSHIDCNYDSIVNAKALADPNYQLTHHEYASIAGVELRKDDSAPDFNLSRQLGQYEQWVQVKRLGRKRFGSFSENQTQTLAQTGIDCTTWPEGEDPKHVLYFSWRPNGDYFVAYQKFPSVQHNWGRTTRWAGGWLKNSWLNLQQGMAHFFGGDIQTHVLYRGNSMELTRETEGPHNFMYRQIQTKPGNSVPNSEDTFIMYTTVAIEQLPAKIRGAYMEFPLHLHVWGNQKVPKSLRYRIHNLICQQAGPTWNGWIKPERIFADPKKDFYEENLIKKYGGRK